LLSTKRTKIVFTGHDSGPKIHPKCFCGRGSTTNPAGELSAPADPLHGFQEPIYSREQEGRGMQEVRRRERRGMEGREELRKGRGKKGSGIVVL